MQRWIAAAALCVLAALPSRTTAQTREQQLEALKAVAQRPLRYTVTPERVDVSRHISVGKRADGSMLAVDLYTPKESAGRPHPVALLLHGVVPDIAPIRPSDWRMYRDWGTVLAQSGIAAVMFDHRYGGFEDNRIDEAMGEIAQVMQWLRQSAPARHFDPSRLAVVSFSAGGLLIPEIVRRYDSKSIGRYVLYYPLFGAETGQPDNGTVAAKLRFQDVIPLLAERRTPLLIFRSGADRIPDLLPRLDAALAAALRQDLALELHNLPGAPHGFDSIQDSGETRRAIARTIEFVGAEPSR